MEAKKWTVYQNIFINIDGKVASSFHYYRQSALDDDDIRRKAGFKILETAKPYTYEVTE